MNASRLALAVALVASAGDADAYELLSCKWWPQDMPIGWSHDGVTDVPEIPGSLELEEVRAAFAAWDAVSFADVELVEGGTAIEVRFEQPLGQGILGQAFLTTESGSNDDCATARPFHLVHATVAFSVAVEFMTRDAILSGACADEYDIRGVAAHEVGHALGIGHSWLGAAMLSAANTCSIRQELPNDDDVAALRALYCLREPSFTASVASFDDTQDPSCTDRDGLPDGGERGPLTLRLHDHGRSALAVIADVSVLDGGLRVLASRFDVGDIAADADVEIVVPVSIDSTVTCGDVARLAIRLTGGAWEQVLVLDVPLQVDLASPTTVARDEGMPDTRWSHWHAWTNDDWLRSTDGCALPDAADFWRVGRRADCRSTYLAYTEAQLEGGLDLPSLPKGRVDLVVHHRRAFAAGDFGRIQVAGDGGSFDLVATVQGDSGGWETLRMDLTGLVYTAWSLTPRVSFYFDADGATEDVGWLVDSVALEWPVPVTACDPTPSCVRPCFAFADAGADRATCAGESVTLNASASRVEECDGTAELTWRSGTTVLSRSAELEVQPFATRSYEVDVQCSTDPACVATDAVTVIVDDVPPPPVGNALRVRRAGTDVVSSWSDALSAPGFRVRGARLDDGFGGAGVLAEPAGRTWTAVGTAGDGTSRWWRVVAVSACAVEELP